MSVRTTDAAEAIPRRRLGWRDDLSPRLRLPDGELGEALPQRAAVRALRLPRDGHVHRDRVRRRARASRSHRAARHARPSRRSTSRRDPRPGVDRVRLDPAAPADPGPRPGGGGAVLGPPHDGRGAAPRLPDAPSADRGRLDLGHQESQRRHGRGDPVDEHRLPRPGGVQHRLRLVRRQRRLLRPDRPRRQVPARDAEDQRLPADGREHAADAARGGLPPRRRRGADAALGDRGGARRGLRHHAACSRRRSTSGCRAGSRCSATSAAAAPT